MRVSKTKVAEHRNAILRSASRLFRERGFDNVGVAEIMHASGLTHGAFYGHFRSKADLAGEACRDACAENLLSWEQTGAIGTILDRYLSPLHRDAPAKGCTVSALSIDIARLGPDMQQDYAEDVVRFIATIAGHLDDEDADIRRRKATAIFAAMSGALAMARAVAEGDPDLSARILADTRAELRARFGI